MSIVQNQLEALHPLELKGRCRQFIHHAPRLEPAIGNAPGARENLIFQNEFALLLPRLGLTRGRPRKLGLMFCIPPTRREQHEQRSQCHEHTFQDSFGHVPSLSTAEALTQFRLQSPSRTSMCAGSRYCLHFSFLALNLFLAAFPGYQES